MIKYKKGDAVNPEEKGIKTIIHVCNCNNGFGSGFVVPLKAKWPITEQVFRSLFKGFPETKWHELLGTIQVIKVEEDTFVINMIAQKGYGKNNRQKHRTDEPNTEIPLQYGALGECLKQVAEFVKEKKSVVVGPRFGSDRAGGNWADIEKLINKHMSDVDVFIYDLPT